MSDSELTANNDISILERLVILVLASVAVVVAAVVVITPLSLREQFFYGIISFGVAMLLNLAKGQFVTLLLMALSTVASTRYLYWRLSTTLELESAIDLTLGSFLLYAEVYSYLVFFLGYFQLAWPLHRRPIPVPGPPEEWPHVDVYIPTYNEALSVVRATALAARAMDWPEDKLHVYILDDGRRAEFRTFAAQAGIGYITRTGNAHAKAGNLNHAMTQTRGEFIAIFDCDHVPTRAFLQMTMGWLVRDPNMALVQTPHHFNSPDPFERNLHTFHTVPNEGELFYGLVQPGNDLWNAAFFCGSCAVIRRSHLQSVGGIATDTVTEDAHTSLRLHRKGYGSAFIGINLASGLATESLSAHIGQRIRWARGMVQIFRIDNPLLGRGLTLTQRFCYFTAMVHFLHALPRLIFILSPLAFLVFGANILNASALMVLVFALPHLAHSTLTTSRINGRHRHSFWSEIYETVLASYIFLPTTLALINPKLGKFNVTAKGGTVQHAYFDRGIAKPYIIFLLLNLLGFGFGVWRLAVHSNPPEVVIINMAWSVYNIIVLGAAVAVAWESQQRRRTTRINAALPAMVRLANGHSIRGKTIDMSQGGAMLELPPMTELKADEEVHLSLFLGEDALPLPAKVVRHGGGRLQLSFENLDIEEESWLIQAIYSRADAWSSWNAAYPKDQPVTSMWNITRHSTAGLKLLTSRTGGAEGG